MSGADRAPSAQNEELPPQWRQFVHPSPPAAATRLFSPPRGGDTFSGPDRTRTPETDSAGTPEESRGLAPDAPALGCIRGAESDLQLVIGAWAKLSAAVRQAVVVIVQGASR